MGWRVLGLCLLLLGNAHADERVTVCYGYGCNYQQEAVFAEPQLSSLLLRLKAVRDDAEERGVLAEVVGQLYRWAGEQTPVHSDRGGNHADEGRGGMDCIDHSLTTTRLLRMLEVRGGLHFHRVVERVRRTRGLIFEHYAAAIAVRYGEPRYYVVDSWFVDNGQPAVVLPLAEWMDGGGPDV